MNYMALIYGPPMPADLTLPPEAIQAWIDYTEATKAAGIYVDGSELGHPSTATTVAVVDGKRVVTDGPFAETKEVLGGYYLFNCDNLDVALDWAAKCPAAAMGGRVEVRPLVAM